MTASYHQTPQIISLLLEYGVDINLTNTYGQTALMLACDNKSRNIENTKRIPK